MYTMGNLRVNYEDIVREGLFMSIEYNFKNLQ